MLQINSINLYLINPAGFKVLHWILCPCYLLTTAAVFILQRKKSYCASC